ncbi:MAG: efflux RND transporter permease subunit [Lentisphaerae bacterium]|nr:efflux RND transporter permease subunit [Lentisphaerota bacterium]
MILTNYAVKTRTAVAFLAGVLAIAGAIAYVTLPREGMPDITIPYIFISAFYEGTSPEEMEKLITIPIEKRVNEADGVKEMRSVSREGVCSISIEFRAGQDIERAKQKVKDKLDLARAELPSDLDEPYVDAFNTSSDFPVFRLALSGPDVGRLRGLAEEIEERLDGLPGVKDAVISGLREREVRVELDPTRMAAFGIPVERVMQRIMGENRTVSAGNIEVSGNKFQVRVPGEFGMAAPIGDILVEDRGGRPVFLRDLGTVVDGFKDVESITRLNGAPGVSIAVKKRVGENSVALIRSVKKAVAETIMPPGHEVTAVYDESEHIAMMVNELENNIATGFILVVAVLLIVMGLRNSLLVGLAIPMSMLTGFVFMAITGFSLNMIVLFSLVLAVGMLVDNAIVVVENTFRLRTEGVSRLEAARRGAGEVAWPVITSTLTTVAAFCPLLFWPDMMGQFMSFMPKTLIVVLVSSLFVGVVINPAICSWMVEKPKLGKRERIKSAGEGILEWYEGLLRGALRNRTQVVLIAFAALASTALAYGLFGAGLELFPETEPRNATVSVAFPQGTSIEKTDAALLHAESVLAGYEDIEFYLTVVGQGGDNGLLGGGVGSHLGSTFIEFRDAADRKGSSSEQVAAIRKEIGAIPGAEVTVEKQEEGPPTGAPVSVEISGADYSTLSGLAAEVVRRLRTIPGLVDVRDDMEDALPEVRFVVDRQRAALHGLDTSYIGDFLRMAIYGRETGKLRVGEEEYDIRLRLPENRRNDMSLLDGIFVPRPGGSSVPLSALGKVEYRGGRGEILRKDRRRTITVMGNDDGRGVDEIMVDVRTRLADLRVPTGYAVTYAGDTKEMQESGAFLAKAFLVAIGGIAVILVLQFNSAVLPSVIMTSVIMSMVGVMWGLLICRLKFGVIMTGVGVISLAGVVVNNAIVLVDCILKRQQDGMATTEAIVEAARTRLRPVLLTAITTILGLIPMAVGYSLEIHRWPPAIVAGQESSAWWAPMAVAVIFGLSVATVLTLVLVPVLVSVIESAVKAVSGKNGHARPSDAAAGVAPAVGPRE